MGYLTHFFGILSQGYSHLDGELVMFDLFGVHAIQML